jgi:hypothetical protein
MLSLKQKFCVLMLKMHLSGMGARLAFLESIFPHMPEEDDAESLETKTFCRTFHDQAARGDIQGQIADLKTECEALHDRLDAIDLESEEDQSAAIDEIMRAYLLFDAKLERAASWAEETKRALNRASVELN